MNTTTAAAAATVVARQNAAPELQRLRALFVASGPFVSSADYLIESLKVRSCGDLLRAVRIVNAVPAEVLETLSQLGRDEASIPSASVPSVVGPHDVQSLTPRVYRYGAPRAFVASSDRVKAAGVLPVRRVNGALEVLLTLEFTYANRAATTKTELAFKPLGGMAEDESAHAAACREFCEETMKLVERERVEQLLRTAEPIYVPDGAYVMYVFAAPPESHDWPIKYYSLKCYVKRLLANKDVKFDPIALEQMLFQAEPEALAWVPLLDALRSRSFMTWGPPKLWNRHNTAEFLLSILRSDAVLAAMERACPP